MIREWYLGIVGRVHQLDKGLTIRGKIQCLFVLAFAASLLVALPILLIDALTIDCHVQKRASETIVRLLENDMAAQLEAIDIPALNQTAEKLRSTLEIDRFCLYNDHKILVKSHGSECQFDALPFVLRIHNPQNQLMGYFYSNAQSDSRYLISMQIGATLCLVIMFFLLSLYMLRRLQKVITHPLVELSFAAEEFMRTNDFHIRVQKHDDDEIGRLSDVFNRLLQDMRKKEHDLIKAKNDADAANEMKGDFLASVSHEIRTPMNGVIGTAELLLESVDNQKQRNYVSTILRSSESLLSIINDILDFSKIESGKLDIECISFNLYNEVEDVADLMAIKACEKDIEIIVSISPYVPEHLLGDPSRLRQVLTNLVSNAVKFTERGHILIEVESIGCAIGDQKRETLKFSVQDTGIGISPQAQKSIFERFTQAESSITRQYGGTGLGLAICKQLVELMGGEIYVESASGKGSTFTFTLSLELDDAQPSEPTTELENIHVLIVDDNPFFTEHLKTALRFYGMRPLCAQTPKEALNIITAKTQTPFDLLIIDENMPLTTGCTLAEQINMTYVDSAPPIILLNEIYTDIERDQLYRNCGIAAYMQKPIRLKQLASLIELTLHEHTHGNGQHILSVDEIRGHNNQHVTPVRFASPHVLIVESNDLHYKTVSKELIQVGCQVQRVTDQNAALDYADQHPLDLLIVSVDEQPITPAKLAALAQLRDAKQEAGSASLPIIALTAASLNRELTRELNTLASVILSKQFIRTALVSKVATLIPEFVLNKDNALVYFQDVNILLVEDNRVNAQITTEILTEFGCQIQLCDNGKQAIDAFTNNHYDLVLMDCQMPVMDGFESTRHIRGFERENERFSTPIIALTANAMKGDSERCLNAGMNDYITKPIRRDKLRNVLTRFIDAQKLIIKPEAIMASPLIDTDIHQRTLSLYQASTANANHLISDLERSMAMLVKQYAMLPPNIVFESVQVIMALADLLGFLRFQKTLKALADAALQLHGSEQDASEALADRVKACEQALQETLASIADTLPSAQQPELATVKSDTAINELDNELAGESAALELPMPEVAFDTPASEQLINFKAPSSSNVKSRKKPSQNTSGQVAFIHFKAEADSVDPQAEAALVDINTFNSTKGIFKSKFDHVLGEYIEDCDNYIDTIERQLACEGFEDIRQSAHPLKSSSFSLGFNAVGEVAKRIELAARKAEDIDSIKAEMASLLEAYASTKAFIQKDNVS